MVLVVSFIVLTQGMCSTCWIQHTERVVPVLGVNTWYVLFDSPFQHAARVVLLVEFNPQCVLFQNLMSTHGASCLTHRINTRYVSFHVPLSTLRVLNVRPRNNTHHVLQTTLKCVKITSTRAEMNMQPAC